MKAYITKIEYVLPKNKAENLKNRLTRKTGIYSRHICSESEIASDLAFEAAKKLFDAGINKNDIDFLILCTQSPDYYLPTTACILQDRLDLLTSCGAFDYNLGCSGYIYGLSMAKGLIESNQACNILLLTAETYSKYINQKDNTVAPLFGDAATATLVSGIESQKNGLDGFIFGTNGNGYQNLIVPVGGMKERYYNTEVKEYIDDFGSYRTNQNLFMNGSAISDFALEVVPDTVDKILKKIDLSKDEIDYFVFHQANKFMLEFLQMKCDLIGYPYWNDVKEYGNTVSNSIPIALKDLLDKNDSKKLKNVMLVGFGVGLSWGGCIVDLGKVRRN